MNPPIALARLSTVAIVILFLSASSSADDLQVKVKQVASFHSSEKQVFVTEADPAEKLLAVGTGDGKILLRDVDTQALIATFNPSPRSVIDLAFHPTKSFLASVSYPNSLTLYDIEANDIVWQKQTASAPTRVVFSRDGTFMSTAEWGGTAVVYETGTGKLITTIKLQQGKVGNVVFSDDGERIYLSTVFRNDPDGRSQLLECETQTGKVLAILGQHPTGRVDRLRLSMSGRMLASLDRFGNLKLWELPNRRIIREWKLDLQMSRGLEFLDERTLIVGGDDQILIVKSDQQEPVAIINTPKGQNNIDAMPRRSAIASTVNRTTLIYQIDDPNKLPFVANAKAAVEGAAPEQPVMDPIAGQKTLLQIGKYDNVPNNNAYFDGLVSIADLRELGDAKLSLTMKSGKTVANAKLTSLVFDSLHHGVKFLRYKTHAGAMKSVKPIDVYSIELNGEPHHFRYWRPEGQLFLLNTKVVLDAASERLAKFGSKTRPLVEHVDQVEATLRSKKFLNEAVGLLASAGKFRVVESQSALVFTDQPEAVAVQIGKKLDQLDAVLNQVFGLPDRRSIWYSKPVVAAFTTPSLLATFEERVMNNVNHAGRGSVRRSKERYLQTVVTDKFDESFTRELCWGYSLGYSQLLHSSFNRYPWINSGIAQSVPDLVLPNKLISRQRRSIVLDHLRRHRSLVGIMTASRLDDSVKPVCCELVAFLQGLDPHAFSQLFRDMKFGVELDRALRNSYGITERELASLFGQSLRVTGVSP